MSIKESKCLIVYFSKHGENYYVGNVKFGNTARLAHMIQNELQCDMIELQPANPYPEDLKKFCNQVIRENEQNERPALKNKITNLEDYDVIFFGYPVYHHDLPMIMYTFIETYAKELEGKTIYPFCTHEGSGGTPTTNKLRKKLNKSNVQKALSVYGQNVDSSIQKVKNWIKKL